MDESHGGEPEETVHEGLELQDLTIHQVQEEGSKDLQSDQKLQRSEYSVQNETSELGITHKLKQYEKEESAQKIKIQDSQQKSEEKRLSRQGCRKLAEDEELKQKADGDIVVQQKDENSFASEQDSSQTNQPDADTIHKEFRVFAEDKLLESDGNTTTQRAAEVPDQKASQITRQEGNIATHQNCDRNLEDETLKTKLETNLTEQLKERFREEISIFLMENQRRIAEGLQQEWDTTAENGRQLQESESGSESGESPHVRFRIQQVGEEASSPLSSRICYHRTRTQLDESFEVEIPVITNRRTLGARPPTVPSGMRDYLRRVSEHHIPPERRGFYEEVQKRILKLLCGVVIGVFFYVAMVFLINFLEDKYGNYDDSGVTSPDDFSDDLNITVIDFEPGTSVTDLGSKTTTPMVDNANFWTDFDIEVTSVLNENDLE